MNRFINVRTVRLLRSMCDVHIDRCMPVRRRKAVNVGTGDVAKGRQTKDLAERGGIEPGA